MTGNYRRETKRIIFKSENFTEDDIVGIIMNLEQEYDQNNRLVMERRYDNEGNLEATMSFQYDDSGNLIEQSEIDSSGEFAQKLTFQYDSMSRLIEKDIFYVDESFDREIYHYNSNNLLDKVEFINYDGEREQITEKRYNNDKLIEENTYDDSGQFTSSKKWSYDDLGREVKFENETEDQYILSESVYDDEGRLILRKVYGKNGNLFETWERIYNPNPYIEEYWETNRFGRSRYHVNYDENNRELSRQVTNENGEIMLEVERLYRPDGLLDRQRIIIHGSGMRPSQFEEYRNFYLPLNQ
ncbi:MAG TPA: hypothetical protein PKG47_01745 [Bacteroidales bacterium]|jgi:hypothetical protein|nr:hypothetical protein [Bacteroidales bacterium]HQN85628.1 hypothetical protein [Bacteroidales bacterium]